MGRVVGVAGHLVERRLEWVDFVGLELSDVGLHGEHSLLHLGHELDELVHTFLGSHR